MRAQYLDGSRPMRVLHSDLSTSPGHRQAGQDEDGHQQGDEGSRLHRGHGGATALTVLSDPVLSLSHYYKLCKSASDEGAVVCRAGRKKDYYYIHLNI